MTLRPTDNQTNQTNSSYLTMYKMLSVRPPCDTNLAKGKFQCFLLEKPTWGLYLSLVSVLEFKTKQNKKNCAKCGSEDIVPQPRF